jgi:hypothetical protein
VSIGRDLHRLCASAVIVLLVLFACAQKPEAAFAKCINLKQPGHFTQDFQSFSRRFPRNQKLDPQHMIIVGMFIQKPLESSGRNRWGRTPSGFPLLQGGEFGWHASGNKSADCFGLAQAVGLPPCLETENHRSRSPLGDGCFVLLGKKSFKCRSGDRLRGGLPYFPGLESSELDWQSRSNQSVDGLRLTEFVQGSPSFQFGDYGRKAAVSGHQRSMMPSAQNAGNSQSRNFFGRSFLSAIYNKVRYRLRLISAQESTEKHRREQAKFSMELATMAIGATAAKEQITMVLTR